MSDLQSYQDVPVDQRGHMVTNKPTTTVLMHKGEPLSGLSAAGRCHTCGKWNDEEFRDGTLFTHKDPCQYPDGFTTVVEIPVPSGQMVAIDDLRPLFDEGDGDGSRSALDDHTGIVSTAALGWFFGPVGNSCPGIYRMGPDKLAIVSPEMYDKDGEETDPNPPDEDRVAWITTDTWRCSVVDGDAYKKRLTERPEHAERFERHVQRFPVRPGVWRFTHHMLENGFDPYGDGPIVFTNIEWVREV